MIRVRVTRARGSTPREAGAEMGVTVDAVTGTIGGGQLEYMAIDRARAMLRSGEDHAVMDVPLGPEIGQCCGGRMELTLDRVAALEAAPPGPWVLVFGAGHVGRALSRTLALLPVRVAVIDHRADELAQVDPALVRRSAIPEAEMRAAPPGSAAIIATHDHATDFLLVAEGLAHGRLAYLGMIGSVTKRAQAERFLRGRGLDPAPLVCPIGAAGLGDKRPEVIAAMVAAEVMGALGRVREGVPCAT